MLSIMAARKSRLLAKLRETGITDTRVLAAIENVPREIFLPSTFYDQSYEDMALPIGQGQTISQPSTVAAMTQALELNDRHIVLEVGTGSGYQASILSKLCRRVYSIERHIPLLKTAEERFQALQIRNITCKAGDGMKGWKEQAPFDRIIVTAAAFQEPPVPLLEQMAQGGIMIIPIGDDRNTQYIYRIVKQDNGFVCEDIMPTKFVPLLPNIASSSVSDTIIRINNEKAQINKPYRGREVAANN